MALTRLRYPEALERFGKRWNELVEAASNDILGLDVTSTCEWTSALRDVRLSDEESYCLVDMDGEAVKGLQPIYASLKNISVTVYVYPPPARIRPGVDLSGVGRRVI